MLISGNPHPNFTWTHEGAVIHDTDDDDILIVQNGPYIDILNIFRPFMFKHAGTYRVNATNDHGSTSDFFEIVIQGKGERERERGERERGREERGEREGEGERDKSRCEFLFVYFLVKSLLLAYKHKTVTQTHTHTNIDYKYFRLI